MPADRGGLCALSICLGERLLEYRRGPMRGGRGFGGVVVAHPEHLAS